MIMPFGKHRGKKVSKIPGDRRVLKNYDNITPYLRRDIERELRIGPKRKRSPTARRVTPSIPFAELVIAWYRQLAKEFHPDNRGSHDAMIAVDRAKDLLVQMSGAEN